jgi:hypothetical protein
MEVTKRKALIKDLENFQFCKFMLYISISGDKQIKGFRSPEDGRRGSTP